MPIGGIASERLVSMMRDFTKNSTISPKIVSFAQNHTYQVYDWDSCQRPDVCLDNSCRKQKDMLYIYLSNILLNIRNYNLTV